MNDAIKWDVTNNACTARSQQQMSLDFHTQGTEDCRGCRCIVGAHHNRAVLPLGFQQSSPIVWKRDEQLELGPSTLLDCNTCMERK